MPAAIYLGIDPGKKGGVVALDENSGVLRILAVEKATELEIVEFLDWGSPLAGRVACMEKLRASKLRGSVANWVLGGSYGFYRGVLTTLGIQREEVAPQKWQRDMGCLSGGDPKVLRQRAQELWPDTRWTNATSAAALIAEWIRRHENPVVL